MLPQRISNISLGAGLAIACVLFIPAHYFIEGDNFFELLNLLLVALSMGTAVAIHPAAWNALKLPVHHVGAGEMLAVSLTLLCASSAQVFGIQYLWRLWDRPDWLINGWYAGFSRWLFFVSILLALIATGAERGLLPSSTYQRAGVVVAGTILFAGLLATFGFI